MLITVITICLNSEKSIEKTITSVINQSYQNIEHIIVDGGSSDSTIGIIRKYENSITKWLSESDNGISDAMNKGVKLSHGDYIIFLHSDDYFYENTSLESIVEKISVADNIIMCDVLFGKSNKRVSPNNFGLKMNFKGVCHQGVLCSRRIFEAIGDFDITFKICMDYDFFLRAYRYGFKTKKIPSILAVMSDEGVSSLRDWLSLSKRFKEECMVHKKNTDSFFKIPMYFVYHFLYSIYWRTKYLINGVNN